jgi:hypothetical protein
MKETTKPNTSHLMKRDLAVNIAVLPLPTPPAGARGEGWGFAEAKCETRDSKSETNSKLEIQETSNIEHRTSNFELTEGTGRGPALINTSLQRGDGTHEGDVNCFNSFSLGPQQGTSERSAARPGPQQAESQETAASHQIRLAATVAAAGRDVPRSVPSPIDLQFPQFLDIAARRDEPLSLSPINEQILTLTTESRLPNV